MSVSPCLAVSIGHITQETMAWMRHPPADAPFAIAPYQHGAFVSVPSDVQIIDELACPEDLRVVMQHACRAGCLAIRFDSDADVIQALPYFDW